VKLGDSAHLEQRIRDVVEPATSGLARDGRAIERVQSVSGAHNELIQWHR
jgi:hypothetical protein